MYAYRRHNPSPALSRFLYKNLHKSTGKSEHGIRMARIIMKTIKFTYLRTQRIVYYTNISLGNHYKPRANIAHERDALPIKQLEHRPTTHSVSSTRYRRQNRGASLFGEDGTWRWEQKLAKWSTLFYDSPAVVDVRHCVSIHLRKSSFFSALSFFFLFILFKTGWLFIHRPKVRQSINATYCTRFFDK